MKDSIRNAFWLLIVFVSFQSAVVSASEQIPWQTGKAFLEIFACKSPKNLPDVPTVRFYWDKEMKFYWKSNGTFLIPEKGNLLNGSPWFARFTFYIKIDEPGWHAFLVNAYEHSELDIEGVTLITTYDYCEGKNKSCQPRSYREEIILEPGIYKIEYKYFCNYNSRNSKAVWIPYLSVYYQKPSDTRPRLIKPNDMLLPKKK